jgi:hypothetical protein
MEKFYKFKLLLLVLLNLIITPLISNLLCHYNSIVILSGIGLYILLLFLNYLIIRKIFNV